MMQSGVDLADSIGKMKDVISAMAKAQEENGLKGSAAFNQLKRYANLVETNQAVIESVKGMNDVYTSLAQVGAMNQTLFGDWQQESLANYDKLIAGGFKQNEALAMMAPTLQSLKEVHETMGFALDENTRKLIEQAEAAGLLKPDPMVEMTEAVKDMTKAVYELIDHIAGHSPPGGSLIDAFDTALMRAQGFGAEIKNAFVADPVQNLIGVIGEIPTNIGIHVGYSYDEYHGPGGGGGGAGGKYYAAQHGGIFNRPTHVVLGENPAHNPEAILNRQQLQKLLSEQLQPARDLSEEKNDQPIIINVYVAGEKVEQVILPMLKQSSRDGKLKIDPRSIE